MDMEAWAKRWPLRAGAVSLSMLGIRVVQRFLDVRVMGLAAEMTYYALLSFFPLIAALGASLGFLERFVGAAGVEAAELAVLDGLRVVFTPQVTADVVAPMVQGLLREEQAGFALGGFLISLFFASRIFRSAIAALDEAYEVEERRGTIPLWGLGLLLSLGAILVATVLVSMVVVGPLLGGGRVIAGWLGLGTAFEVAWAFARWPAIFVIATAFLWVVYRFGPNANNGWKDSLPGAVFGMIGLLLVTAGFRLYIELTGVGSPQLPDAETAVLVALQAVGALLAVLFWVWLSSTAMLTGGVLNAELARLRDDPR
jgi:membrane protein